MACLGEAHVVGDNDSPDRLWDSFSPENAKEQEHHGQLLESLVFFGVMTYKLDLVWQASRQLPGNALYCRDEMTNV